MTADSTHTSQFRHDLVAALNSNPSSIDFEKLVAGGNVSRADADLVAQKLLAQLIRRSLEDGVITDAEQHKLDQLARLLAIPDDTAVDLLARVGKSVLRKEIKEAHADGVITAEEGIELQQLRKNLRLAVSNSVQSDSRTSGVAMVQTDQASGSPAHPVHPLGDQSDGKTTQPVGDDAITQPPSFNEADVVKTQRFQVSATPARLLNDVKLLRDFDRAQEKRLTKFTMIGVAGFVSGVIGLVVLVGSSSSFDPSLGLQILGSALLGVGAIAAIGGVGMRIANAKTDLADYRYELMGSLVGLLGKDMAADAPVSVNVDFRPHNHSSKLERKGKAGYWNVNFNVDQWLQMQGRFVDGTKFSVVMIEKQQDRHRTKRSASGKIKHKKKTKNKSEAIVTLKIKEKRYPQAQDLFQQAQQSVKLPKGVSVKSVTADGEGLTLRSTRVRPWPKTGASDADNWVAMMFLSLYHILNESKSEG